MRLSIPALALIALLGLSGALVSPVRASVQDLGYIPIDAGENGDVAKAKLDQLIKHLKAQIPPPKHVFVLVHGFEVPDQPVTELYSAIAKRLRSSFATVTESVQVVGVRWPAGRGGNYDSVQRTFSHTAMGAGLDPKFYLEKVAIAGRLGRMGLRKILLSLNEAFPDTRVHTLANSLGGEVVACSLQTAAKGVPCYKRDEKVALDLSCFVGADISPDQTVSPRYEAGVAQLFWITQGRPGEKRDQLAKNGRFLIPRKAAAPGMLKFRTDQLNKLLGSAKLVYDTDDLPADQSFLKYCTTDRLERLARAAATLRNPSKPVSDVLVRLNEVLQAPASVEGLARYLTDPELSVVMTALWRLDRALCGSADHLADETLRRAASVSHGKPLMSAEDRKLCPCRIVSRGIWPPAGLLPAEPEEEE